MASTNKTENYGLNQWVKTDPVLMDDFNEDNRKIDEAMAGIVASLPKFASGSYVGTDTYGRSNKSSLTFDFQPKVLFIGELSVVYGQADAGYCNFTWEGNTVSWFSTQNATVQMNSSLYTYYYFAIA